ncbi:MAG: T9SS type A sorting domain-containing protein, partial [Bacteroidales bacterium]|nr:T9SS type A sorting domain-containing protein [Bacteroidales bacterium]
MKKIVTTLFIIAFSFPTFSQGTFQWAKSYYGSDETASNINNRIYHTELDSQGNMYILGNFRGDVTLDGERIFDLAFGVYSGSLLIAKLNPEGNLLWKKVIRHSFYPTGPNYMKLVGDSSLFVMTQMSLGYNNSKLWYFDTLIEVGFYDTLPTYPFPFYDGGNISSYGNVFIEFDLNGNVRNQHFLQIKSLDSNAVEIGVGQPPFSDCNVTSPFHIDNNGNMYMYSRLYKLYPPVLNDTVTEYPISESFRLIIDGVRTIDFGMKYNENAKLFKFSPNFGELIWSKDIMEDTVGIGEDCTIVDNWGIRPYEKYPIFITGMEADNEGDLYVCGYIEHNRDMNTCPDTLHSRTIFVDTTNREHRIEIDAGAQAIGFIIKYDTAGNVQWVNQMRGYTQFAGNSQGFPVGFATKYQNLAIKEEDNSVFVLADISAGQTQDINTYLKINDTLVYRKKDGSVAFLKYNKNNGQYISHGVTNHIIDSLYPWVYGGSGTSLFYGFGTDQFIVNNNQVLALIIYVRNIVGFDTIIYSLNSGFVGTGMALCRWREDGGLIELLDFPTNSSGNKMKPGGVKMGNNGDIILYGCVENEISFGPFNVGQGSAGDSRAFIAKYSDPSFSIPYEGEVYFYEPISIDEVPSLKENNIVIYPNPTKGEVNLISTNERINSYTVYNMGGQTMIKSEKLKTKSEKLNLSSLPKGVYVIKVITDKNTYT